MPFTVEVEDTGPQVVVKGKTYNIWETKQNTPDDLYRREVRTVRRVFRGDPVRHGKTRVYNRRGTLVREENWRFGTLHGSFVAWDDNENLLERGTYKSGVVDGKWVTQHRERKPESKIRFQSEGSMASRVYVESVEKLWPLVRDESEYRGGIPIGKWKHFHDGFLMSEEEFDEGVLVGEAQYRRRISGSVSDVSERRRDKEHAGGTFTRWYDDREAMLERTPFRTLPEPEAVAEPAAVLGKIPASRPLERDERHGFAQGWDKRGQKIYEGHWFADRPAGKWVYWDDLGNLARELEFDRGALVRADSRSIDDFTREFRYFKGSAIDNQLRARLDSLVTVDFDGQPLDHLVAWLKVELPNVDVELRREALAAANIDEGTVKLQARNIPLGAALCLLLEPQGLVAVYRHEQLWITTAADVSQLSDRTGVMALRPISGSKVERALGEPSYVECQDTPIKYIAEWFKDLSGVEVIVDDEVTGSTDPKVGMTLTYSNGHGRKNSFRAVLGRILEKYNLACETRGEAIYICLPKRPPLKAAAPNR